MRPPAEKDENFRGRSRPLTIFPPREGPIHGRCPELPDSGLFLRKIHEKFGKKTKNLWLFLSGCDTLMIRERDMRRAAGPAAVWERERSV